MGKATERRLCPARNMQRRLVSARLPAKPIGSDPPAHAGALNLGLPPHRVTSVAAPENVLEEATMPSGQRTGSRSDGGIAGRSHLARRRGQTDPRHRPPQIRASVAHSKSSSTAKPRFAHISRSATSRSSESRPNGLPSGIRSVTASFQEQLHSEAQSPSRLSRPIFTEGSVARRASKENRRISYKTRAAAPTHSRRHVEIMRLRSSRWPGGRGLLGREPRNRAPTPD